MYLLSWSLNDTVPDPCCFSEHNADILIGKHDKRGTPPEKNQFDWAGDTDFKGEILDLQSVVNINPTAQHDVWASMIHYSSRIHH